MANPQNDQLAILWIVCPSYDDVASFRHLREALIAEVDANPALAAFEVQFVVIDDTAGRDGEIAGLRDLADVTVVTPPFNLGHQRAIVYGLRIVDSQLADHDIIVTMDADGEDRPADLGRLLAPLLEREATSHVVSLALRTQRQESLQFRLMYACFKTLFRALTGVTVRNGNYAAYRGALAHGMLLHPYFDLCYSSTLISLDLDVVFVPCPRGTRYEGQSRMNTLRLVMHGVRMLMPFIDRIAVRALFGFTLIFGIGVASAIAVIGIRIFTDAAIPGWTTTTLLGSLGGSLVALCNFIVLFAVFSHSRGISLAHLEDDHGKHA